MLNSCTEAISTAAVAVTKGKEICTMLSGPETDGTGKHLRYPVLSSFQSSWSQLKGHFFMVSILISIFALHTAMPYFLIRDT